MVEFFDENLAVTDDFRDALPDLLGDDYYNDEEQQEPTKEFDNIKDLPSMLKKTLHAARKISAHGEELKKATEGMIKVPGEGATEEEVAAYRKALGIPDGPEGYELTIPEKDKEGYEAVANAVKEAAHEEGIAPSKISGVWDRVVNVLNERTEALEKKGMELLAADVQALKDVKKEKYDSFIAETNKVAAHFDIKGDPALGTKDNLIGSEFMKLMDSMGIKDTPVVREFLGAIAPLVTEGKTVVGAGTPAAGGQGGFSYQYDENGKPI